MEELEELDEQEVTRRWVGVVVKRKDELVLLRRLTRPHDLL